MFMMMMKYFMGKTFFSEIFAYYEIIWKKENYGIARQATDEN